MEMSEGKLFGCFFSAITIVVILFVVIVPPARQWWAYELFGVDFDYDAMATEIFAGVPHKPRYELSSEYRNLISAREDASKDRLTNMRQVSRLSVAIAEKELQRSQMGDKEAK